MSKIVREVKGVMFNTRNPRTINGKKFYWSDHSKSKAELQKKAKQVRQQGLAARIVPTYEKGIVWWTLLVHPGR